MPHRTDGRGNPTGDSDYYALLARHDAMRLRRQLLAPDRPQAPASAAPLAPPRPALHMDDHDLIARQLSLVTPFEDLIAHLYDVMFRRHPYLRSLFPESMAFQREHLARMFHYLTENADSPDEVTATFTRLGRDHRKLGVRPVHYDTFEDALREALRLQAGRQWTPELEGAWVRMLRHAVDAMVAGAEAALTEPPYWHAVVVGHELRRPDLAVLRVKTHEPYPYRAGQYGALESPALPHAWRHYSMACAPRPDNVVEFHVRRTGPGGVSDALVARTGVGDVLRLGPATGTMTIDDDLPTELLLVAGGTGLAPAKALLEELATRRPGHRRVRLFLGAREAADLYDGAWLAEFERRRPWLRVVPVLEDPAAGGPAALPGAPARHGVVRPDSTAYVSGPPAMVRATAAALRAAGLDAGRILHDPVGPEPAALPAASSVSSTSAARW